ncbi:MAG TPA: GAF domain-containing protein [Anaerolineae bacterium]|nr:GAF domain-containing protein [Anaerolineae bacterium]
MKTMRTWFPQPLDWLAISLRWFMLSALPIVAGLSGVISLGMAFILIVWILFSFAITFALASSWKPSLLQTTVVFVDLVFALAVIGISGMLASPLWWSLLIASVTIGFRLGMKSVLIVSSIGGAAAAVMILLATATSPWTLVPVMLQSLALILAAIILGWMVSQVRLRVLGLDRIHARDRSRSFEQAHEEARELFQIATALNATLNYEEVLEKALDLSAKVLSGDRHEDDRLISSLWIFSSGGLRVASARRLAETDWDVLLPAKEGAIHQAFQTSAPQIIQSPPKDPELSLLTTFRSPGTAVCIPLSSGLEAYGMLLFAHKDRKYFTTERLELLQAVGDQTMIALQNANLFKDLLLEKERITEIQEETRKQLARDLHDGPTQSIASIAMRINFARRLMERDLQATSKELSKVENLARRTTKEIRHMLFTLRPLILETRGLIAALHQLAGKIHDTHGQIVVIETEDNLPVNLDMGKQAVLFYIAEEAINNARKHAEAEHIWLRTRSQDDMFVLEVEDDGVGFNVGSVDSDYEQRGSLGMVNMRERTELINGVFHVDSTEGQGTFIQVFVPLTEASTEQLQDLGSSIQE